MAWSQPLEDVYMRGFSDSLRQHDSGNAMARGLAARMATDENDERKAAALRDQWNMFLMEGRELAISRRLYAAWAAFCKQLPESQQANLRTELPSIRLLYQSVESASATWEAHRNSKTGRAKKAFSRLCDTLSTHSNLVSIFPTDDKYVRLVTGSLSAIAQASVNHEKLASGVTSTLEDLSQDMSYWNDLINEYHEDSTVQRHLIELYVVVTEFLTDVFTQWSRSPWKRFIKSFDQDAFRSLFDEKRKRIQAIVQRMEQRANLAHQIRVRKQINSDTNYREDSINSQNNTQLQIEILQSTLLKLGSDVQTLVEALMRDDQHHLSNSSRLLLTQQAILEETRSFPKLNSIEDKPVDIAKVHDIMLASTSHSASDNDDSSRIHTYCTQQDALDILQVIAAKFKCDTMHLVEITTRALRKGINQSVRTSIGTWTNSARSNAIWIQGPHDVVHPSQNTMAAAYLVALCNKNQIPCLSFFCSLQIHSNNGHALTTRWQLLTTMIKSLIVQLLLMPRSAGSSLDITKRSFEEVARDDVDVAVGLQLLQKMHPLLPPVMYCVIDGMQELEDRGDRIYTKTFLTVLKGLIALSETNVDRDSSIGADTARAEDVDTMPIKTVKLCFVTDGHVDALAEMTREGRVEKLMRDDDLGEVDQED